MVVGQFSGIVLLYSCKNLRSDKKLQLKRTFPYYLFFTAPFLLCCKERYQPDIKGGNIEYLVVDGFLNNSSDSTFIRLSLTRKLDSNLLNTGVRNAQMTIEDNSGNTYYYFTELNSDGVYTIPGLNLDNNNKYRLRIKMAGGKQYLSDEITVQRTPPIDSISWKKTSKGVTIYSNTHDPLNNTRYYRWEYTNTWQYHTDYLSRLRYDTAYPGLGQLAGRDNDELIYTCWKTERSFDLLLGSSAKLTEDIIYEYPIRFIASNSIELSVKYSILLKQYVLTREAYEYLQNLKKNTEQTGSIFDAQPSELSGNIHTVNNSKETILGFITACNMDSMRIYITNEQVAPWVFGPSCTRFLVPKNSDSIELYFNHLGYIPIEYYNSSVMSPIWGSLPDCADCRRNGGQLQKPGFWQ